MAKRKKKAAEEDKGDSNVILFTALGMILLAFFIMLNNMASLDESKTRAALNSLVGTFGILKGHDLERAGLEGAPVFDGDDASDQAAENEKNEVFEVIRKRIAENPIKGMEVTVRDDGRVVIRFDHEVAFTEGGVRVSPEFFTSLDRLGSIIEEVGYPVRVEGHTDARKPKRGVTNWYLSAARAHAVQRYLVATSEMNPDLIDAAGFADSRPDDRSESQRRRVEVVFIPPEFDTRAPQIQHDEDQE